MPDRTYAMPRAMKQVIRKGLKDIIVDEVPDPIVTPHHVLVRPLFSLIGSGTETASIHQGVLKEVADNPSQTQFRSSTPASLHSAASP